MTTDHPAAMDEEAVATYLGEGGTGVLSLSTDTATPPHAVPVSYGFDPATGTLYFRLAVGPDSAKTALADRPVTFVTYGEDDDRWQSVVARGHLEDVEASGIETETLTGLDRVEIPLVDMFDQPTRTVDFEFYRLVPDELTGRVETPSRE